MKQLFTQSENYKSEYSCSIVRVEELTPVEGSDFLVKTTVNGESVVVRHDEVKTGDVMFYISNECEISGKFLFTNNLYNNSLLNSNAREEDAEQHKGFFEKTGRVRMIKLRGVPSYGFLFRKSSLVKLYPELERIDLDQYVGTSFDTVCGDILVKSYVPYIKHTTTTSRTSRRDRFNTLVDGTFKLHYDTELLGQHVDMLHPSTVVTISTKLHGTSIVLGNIQCNLPVQLPLYKKFINGVARLFTKPPFPSYHKEYRVIYSSRTVIKNRWVDKGSNPHTFEPTTSDVWGKYYRIIGPWIPKDTMVYGEIVGSSIQKGYDYGCPSGTDKIMIYRVVENGWELSMPEVGAWVQHLIETSGLHDTIIPTPILYRGTLQDLYPEIPVDENYGANILEAMKHDKTRLGMEAREPMCKNKVPREGVVVRFDDMQTKAFKLKTDAFKMKEAKMIDEGNIDIEMNEQL